jgi:mannonate dehydratase
VASCCNKVRSMRRRQFLRSVLVVAGTRLHFRNVTGPLPHFVETFPDDGYMDMHQVMKALRQVHFNGAVEPDHVPRLAGDTGLLRAGTAYCIASMRAMMRAQ